MSSRRRDFASDEARQEARRRRVALLTEVDELELTIERLVQGGDGLARYRGIPIFVALTAPGDRVRARVTKRRPDYARAEVIEILEPSPDRRAPPCAVFGRCGGCDMQQLEDSRQTELKVAAARETLERLGGVPARELDAEVHTAEAWGYRLRAQWHLDRVGDRVAVGYLGRGSHDLVAIDTCPVLHPRLEELLRSLPETLAEIEDLPRRLDVTLGEWDLSCAPPVAGLPHGPITLRVKERSLELDARTFFQGHSGLLETLVEEAVGESRSGLAWDLYAGVGLFSTALAARCERLVAVESDRIAARYLKRNLRNSDARCSVHNRSVEAFLKERHESPDRIVVDPPRRGLGGVVTYALLRLGAERISYVSCEAATLARDLRALAAGYRLESIAFVDLFPQTSHLETIVQLRARGSAVPGEAC